MAPTTLEPSLVKVLMTKVCTFVHQCYLLERALVLIILAIKTVFF